MSGLSDCLTMVLKIIYINVRQWSKSPERIKTKYVFETFIPYF